MTAETSVDVREVIFVNQRCEKDYLLLPQDVGETADGYIDAMQNSRTIPATACQPIANDRTLAGVYEIKLPYDGDTYRVYAWLGCQHAVWILDAGTKKSPSGREIPQWQKDRLAERLKIARGESDRLAPDLWKAYTDRAKRRRQLERSRSDG